MKPSFISVLMAVHNGARYLSTQLHSIKAQTLTPNYLVTSDDASSDDSVEIIARETQDWTACKTAILKGPNRGYGENFSFLMNNIPENTTLLALSDQDDKWMPDKLERAHSLISKFDPNTPVLYGSRTQLCDENLRPIGPSKLFRHQPQFLHAMTQNFAGGNTMLLNKAAIDLVKLALPGTPKNIVHDWWLYQLISGCGGHVIYDQYQSVMYRQHGGNAIGANIGFGAGMSRFRDMTQGRYREWNSVNIEAMHNVSAYLTPNAREIVEQMPLLRQPSLIHRLQLLHKLGLHRSSVIGQLGLLASVAFRKF